MNRLQLIKWYLDISSEDEVGYYYIMVLKIGRVRCGATGIYHFDREKEIRSFKLSRFKELSFHSLALSKGSLKMSLNHSHLKIDHGKIGIEGKWESRGLPLKRLLKPLFKKNKYWCDWKVWAALADVRLVVKNMGERRDIHGKGYIDFVRFSFPFWKVPFRKLYWGRLHNGGSWIVLAQFQTEKETISLCYEPDGRITEKVNVTVKKDNRRNITGFVWSLGSGNVRILNAEVTRILEDQEVLDRTLFSLLFRPFRRFISSQGVDRKFAVRAKFENNEYHGIMEEVTWNAI